MIIIITLITIFVLAAILPAADVIITYRKKRKEGNKMTEESEVK